MFKQIFENKIGEKLNTFNNSGKVAFEWMDKFRQSLDITEKIQQQFNSLQNVPNGMTKSIDENLLANSANSVSPLNSPQPNGTSASNSNNEINYPSRNNSFKNKKPLQHANSYNQPQSTKKEEYDNSAEYLNQEDNLSHSFNNHVNSSPPASPINPNNSSVSSFNSIVSPKSSIKSGNKPKLMASLSVTSQQQQQALVESNSSNNDFSLSSSSSLSQKSTDQCHTLNHLQQSKSIAEETFSNDSASINGCNSPVISNKTALHSRSLVRQATDLTSSFPLKPFQKINSETVEIPGLNVKVVRYRIENDLGKIEPHLYIKYNVGGIESNAAASKGKLYFTMRYNEEIQSFSVTINKAEVYNNLHPINSQSTPNASSLSASTNMSMSKSTPSSPNLNKPDTYVKIQLLPDKKRKYQTKIQRKTWEPVFEETFYFQLPFEELQNKTLYLQHLEFGRFSKHELIGSVRVSDLNLIKDLQANEVEFVRSLVPLAEDDLELGELTLTLCYLPAAGRLTVTVVKAINLKAMDINGKSDPYVKVTLVIKGKRLKKKKTSVMKNTLHPVYNESMLFDIPQDQIEQVDMVVKVIDYDRVGSNELIGCIGIGPSFNGVGRDHWYRMLENPRKPITQSYYLRDSSFLREGLPAKVEKALNSERQNSIESRSIDY